MVPFPEWSHCARSLGFLECRESGNGIYHKENLLYCAVFYGQMPSLLQAGIWKYMIMKIVGPGLTLAIILSMYCDMDIFEKDWNEFIYRLGLTSAL